MHRLYIKSIKVKVHFTNWTFEAKVRTYLSAVCLLNV